MTEPIHSPFMPDVPVLKKIDPEVLTKVAELLKLPDAFFVVALCHVDNQLKCSIDCDGHEVMVTCKGISEQQVHQILHGMLDDLHKNFKGHQCP